MAGTVERGRQHESSDERQAEIVDVLVDAFSGLMDADPEAFRQKFRKMAAGPFAVGSTSTSVPAAACPWSTFCRRASSCGPTVWSIGLVS